MKPSHAVTMLFGITPSCGPKDAVAMAMRIGSLRRDGAVGFGDQSQHLSGLSGCTTFGEAIEMLLQIVPELIEDDVVYYDDGPSDDERLRQSTWTTINGGHLYYIVSVVPPTGAKTVCQSREES